MRVLLVDSVTELIRCNFKFRRLDDQQPQIERLAKTAACLLDCDEIEPEKYEFDSFTPYKDKEGYFIFITNDDEAARSPTTLQEVLSSCSYVGYVRRVLIDEQLPIEASRSIATATLL